MNKVKIIRKTKALFFRFELHRIIPSRLLILISQLASLSKWINTNANIGFTDFYTPVFDSGKRTELYRFLISNENLNSNIDYLEFGVAKGISIKWWVENISDINARFYGFDTFTGLPEDWGHFKKGDMSANNKVPDINDMRCSFFQGLFQQTLPQFLKTYSSEKRKVIHMDADLYTSTLFVLTSLSPVLKKGDIILFDEFNVPLHEYKAFIDWTRSYYIDYQTMGSVNNFYQTAIKIL